MTSHLRATRRHLPYGITQCYLPPSQVNAPRLTPAKQAGTLFTYPGGMEGWVDLGDLLHTKMVYPTEDGHPSKYKPGRVLINYIDRTQRANHYTTPLPKCCHLV